MTGNLALGFMLVVAACAESSREPDQGDTAPGERDGGRQASLDSGHASRLMEAGTPTQTAPDANADGELNQSSDAAASAAYTICYHPDAVGRGMSRSLLI